MEIPGLNGMLSDFEALDTQVLGVSVDSKFSHKAWSVGFGGIKYPLLADFHPKGGVAKDYGCWLDEPGHRRPRHRADRQGRQRPVLRVRVSGWLPDARGDPRDGSPAHHLIHTRAHRDDHGRRLLSAAVLFGR